MAAADQPQLNVQSHQDFMALATRPSPAGLTDDSFNPNTKPDGSTLPRINVLLIGAGGIGCELLHAIAVSPLVDLCNFAVIDLDTIDLSNLNRQFLFRQEHVDKSKAKVTAEVIEKRYPQIRIMNIHGDITKQPIEFYRNFKVVLMGLDSIHARQWMNQTAATMWHEDAARAGGDYSKVQPILMVDGGTESYKGSVRRIILGDSPCVECMMDQFPVQKGVPMCTLENVPRNPAHCVLYIMEKVFKDERPFGATVEKPDGDNEEMINWIMVRAQARAKKFNIAGEVSFSFTQGVVKNIVPAVGFSNALVGATIVNETIKLLTGVGKCAASQIQYDGSCQYGMGSTTPPTFPTWECIECTKRKHFDMKATDKFPALAAKAWEVFAMGRENADPKRMPDRLKIKMHIGLHDFTIYPPTNAMCVGAAKDDTKTLGESEVKKYGKTFKVGAGTVCALHITTVDPPASQDDDGNPIPVNDDKIRLYDLCYHDEAIVMCRIVP